jgi:hypothetical protein
MQLMIQTLFPNNGEAFQDDIGRNNTAGAVHLRFEEHEGELQHLPWPAHNHRISTSPNHSVGFGD